MKTSARTLKGQKGFSLIELMIVVAIIGILATIAVPNFTRFQNKAKQSEARANLSAVYAAHKAFFAEWNQYHGVMADIGYVPEGKLIYFLVTGAANAPAPTTGFVAATGVGAGCVNTAGCASLLVQRQASHVAGAATGSSTGTTFTAGANANLRGANMDQWSINQDKVMTNVLNGI